VIESSGAVSSPLVSDSPCTSNFRPDEESPIMPVAGGGFEQCYNAQAVVVVARHRRCAGAPRQAAGQHEIHSY